MVHIGSSVSLAAALHTWKFSILMRTGRSTSHDKKNAFSEDCIVAATGLPVFGAPSRTLDPLTRKRRFHFSPFALASCATILNIRCPGRLQPAGAGAVPGNSSALPRRGAPLPVMPPTHSLSSQTSW